MSTPAALAEEGLLLVDKPVGWTSFDVVNKLRGGLSSTLGRRVKVGHAGTLDPLATGLLILAYGARTKELPQLTGLDKTYTGTLTLGAITPSHDLETEVTERRPWEHLDRTAIDQAFARYTGEVMQRPPLYSAKHHKGERAYFLARQGSKVLIDAVPVMIHALNVLDLRGPEVDFRVRCGKGTYIRALAQELGDMLGCGAHLSALRRTHIGEFDVSGARTPQDWSKWFDEVSGKASTI